MGGKLKRLFWLWIQCFKSMRNVQTFIPFLLYAIFQAVLLYALINFSRAPFSGIFVPLIQKIFGDAALHFPNFYMVLTPLYSQINIIFSGLVGILLIGIATLIFAGIFNNHKTSFGQALSITMSKYGALFLVWIIVAALTLIMILGFPKLLNKLLQPSYSIGRIFDMVGLLLGILVASIFAYGTILIVIEKQGIISALSNTFLIFKKNAVTSFILVAVPTFFYFPISYLTRKSAIIITDFSPDVIILLLGAGIVISLFGSYFQVGSITRFYLLLTQTPKS